MESLMESLKTKIVASMLSIILMTGCGGSSGGSKCDIETVENEKTQIDREYAELNTTKNLLEKENINLKSIIKGKDISLREKDISIHSLNQEVLSLKSSINGTNSSLYTCRRQLAEMSESQNSYKDDLVRSEEILNIMKNIFTGKPYRGLLFNYISGWFYINPNDKSLYLLDTTSSNMKWVKAITVEKLDDLYKWATGCGGITLKSLTSSEISLTSYQKNQLRSIENNSFNYQYKLFYTNQTYLILDVVHKKGYTARSNSGSEILWTELY
jgi:hypothetical protein